MIQFVRDVAFVLNAPCREHAGLLSRDLDEPLRRGLRVGLWLHLRMCAGCRAFKAQIARLRALHAADAPSPHATMPAEVRARIERGVRESSL